MCLQMLKMLFSYLKNFSNVFDVEILRYTSTMFMEIKKGDLNYENS